MITIYFIDEFYSSNNGLATYNNAISNGISSPDIQFINVYINSNIPSGVKKTFINGTYQLYFPVFPDEKTENFQIYKCLEADMKGKQQVIVHFNWIGHLPVAWFLKKNTKCLTLLTSHCILWRDFVTDNFDEFYRMDIAFKNNEVLKKIDPKIAKEKILYESIDHFITVTDQAKKSLNFFFEVSSEKVTTIRNGLNVDIEIKNRLGRKKTLRLKYGISSLDKVLLYVGKVEKRKGIIDLIKGFEKLLDTSSPNENLKLIIIGDGDHSQAIRACKKYWSKIIFTGPLDKDKIYDFYSLADVGVVPSYIEQCSYSTIEMMMFSVPIIVSNIDGLSEMVKKDSGLKTPINFVENKGASLDIDVLCKNISNFLYNNVLAKKMAINAERNAQKMFSLKKMVDSHVELYKKMYDDKNKQIINTPQKNELIFIQKRVKPKVSIILPCYNGEKYLQECLKSIYNQSFQNFELLFINDGSNDKSKEIVNNFKDSRLVYMENQKNIGITASLNKAITKAKGKYIARIDTDDIMAEERLKLQVSFLDKHYNYGLIGSSYELIDQYGMVLNRIDLPKFDKELKLEMLFKNQIMHPGVIMRTDLALKFNYSDEFKYCEDYNLWTKISKVSKIANLPEYLLSYRIHNDNISIVNNEIMKKNTLLLISRELSSLNIPHTSQDLMIHSAFIFGDANRIFNDDYKKRLLRNWIDRILQSKKILEYYNQDLIDKYKDKISVFSNYR